ncbi:hypothetical protein BC827DRAFT_596514 [Russula dissimulans]|nr:hypothetical protein BC827DRAFT_596514 [Russula dissimulans]
MLVTRHHPIQPRPRPLYSSHISLIPALQANTRPPPSNLNLDQDSRQVGTPQAATMSSHRARAHCQTCYCMMSQTVYPDRYPNVARCWEHSCQHSYQGFSCLRTLVPRDGHTGSSFLTSLARHPFVVLHQHFTVHPVTPGHIPSLAVPTA